MQWIFFHQPEIPHKDSEEVTGHRHGLSRNGNNISYSRGFLQTWSVTRLNSVDFEELARLLPCIVILTILFIILLAVSFRRWPGMVAGVVAGCLTSLSIYLITCSIASAVPIYE